MPGRLAQEKGMGTDEGVKGARGLQDGRGVGQSIVDEDWRDIQGLRTASLGSAMLAVKKLAMWVDKS